MTQAPAATTAPAQPGGALSWQQRLSAKRRKRVVHRVQVSDEAGDITARVEAARRTYDLVQVLPTATEEMRAQAAADLTAAEAELDGHVVEIAFEALPADAYDAVMALHPTPDPDEDGGVDWRATLPVLAAACCAEDGSSEEYWTAALAQDSWTKADLMTLWGTLLRLHTRAPSPRIPFA